VAGAAGVIGRLLVPMLVEAGHEVTGTTRSAKRARWLRAAGAEPAVLDATDAIALREAVVAARPEVVTHQLTDLAGGFGREQLKANSRLREIATRHLVEAAVAAGAQRFIAQSGAWLYADGPVPHGEDDPLRDPSAHPDDVVLPGILALERLVTGTAGLEGIVLRYGFFHGPGAQTAMPADPPTIHLPDAAAATVAAVSHGEPGIYNVTDDGDPVASNARARERLGWTPIHRGATWP
jgi:nucleoside-diphosphate-sugar epimerase